MMDLPVALRPAAEPPLGDVCCPVGRGLLIARQEIHPAAAGPGLTGVSPPAATGVWVGCAVTAGLGCRPRPTWLATATLATLAETTLADAGLFRYAHASPEKAAS